MKSNKLKILSIVFFICYLAIGIPYWQMSYSAVSIPDSLYALGLLLVLISALVLCFYGYHFLWSAGAMGSCAPAVVATRIIIDIYRDDSTHNLWPFEILIAVTIGFTIAGFGAALGVLIKKIFGKSNV